GTVRPTNSRRSIVRHLDASVDAGGAMGRGVGGAKRGARGAGARELPRTRGNALHTGTHLAAHQRLDRPARRPPLWRRRRGGRGPSGPPPFGHVSSSSATVDAAARRPAGALMTRWSSTGPSR